MRKKQFLGCNIAGRLTRILIEASKKQEHDKVLERTKQIRK